MATFRRGEKPNQKRDPVEFLSPTPSEYGTNYQDHLLEQYKIFVQTEESLVSRRQEENRFFLSVNSLLLAVLGLLIREGIKDEAAGGAVAIIGVAGICLCFAWFSIINSYKDLNSAKFVIIDAFERKLPASMFMEEWSAAQKLHYKPFTKIERYVPFIFGFLNVVAVLVGVLGAAGTIHI